MGKRGRPPHLRPWWQRACSPLASALRRLRPGPPAIALIVAEMLALGLLAVLLWPTGDASQTASVAQPSATLAARPSYTPPPVPIAEAIEPERPVVDPAAVFGNLPPPMVEETFDVSPFDSPRLDGGIYHLSPDGIRLVRIKSEIRAPRTFEDEAESAVTPDGRWLAFTSVVPAPPYTTLPSKVVLYIKDLASHEPAQAVANFARVTELIVSPDGQKLIAGGLNSLDQAERVGEHRFLLDIARQTVRELPQLDAAGTFSWSPTGEQILFQQSDPQSGKSALFLADGDGENVRRLLDDVSGDAAWSPDGSQIAVADCCRHEGAHLVRLDGTTTSLRNVRPLDDPLVPSQFSWSPDGSRIAFHSREYSSDVLTVDAVDVNTGEITDLGPGEDPVWSHDGSRIAYLRDGKLYLALPDGREAWPVISPMQSFIRSVAWSASDSGFVFSYKTSPMHAIWKTTLGGDSEQFLAYGDTPVWSPDGTMIAFVGKIRRASEYGDRVVSDSEVWVITSDGSRPHKLGSYRSYGNSDECARPVSWSADSSQLFFGPWSRQLVAPADGSAPPREVGAGCGPGTSPAGNGAIKESASEHSTIVYDAEGAEVLRLPGDHAQWSPDGTRIAYWTSENNRQLHLVDYPSGATMAHSQSVYWEDIPPELSWSPNGKSVMYSRDGWAFVLNVDDPAADFNFSIGGGPAWSPDGSLIAFAYDDADLGPGIYVTASDNHGRRSRIADGTGPVWSPNGAQIAFTR